MMLSADSLFGNSGLPLRVQDATARTPTGRVTVDAVKVLFTISGWSEVYSGSDATVLTEGTVLVIPAGLECSGHPAAPTRTVTFYLQKDCLADQVRWLHPVHPLVHHMQRALHGDRRLRTLRLPPRIMQRLTPQLARLARLPHRADYEFTKLATTNVTFDAVGRFAGLPAPNADSTEPAGMRSRREVIVAIALLQDHLAYPWHMRELAQELALSASQLNRLFRSQLGISPAAFLRKLRSERMAEILASGHMSVSEAARVVGWHNPGTGSRAFKQRYGVSPREYEAFHRCLLTRSTLGRSVRGR